MEETPDLFKILSKSKIKLTNEINIYRNNKNNKCINEFEIINKISRGLIWRVYKVLRYFYSDESSSTLQTECYALKKSHINTQKKRRYYIEDTCHNYFDKIKEEIKILATIDLHDNIIKLHEVIYSSSHEFIYLICEYSDMGTIMNKHEETFDFYHNYELIEYLLKVLNMEHKLEHEATFNNLIKRNSIPYVLKCQISKIIFGQIFRGLNHLHKNRVSHRDIKPDNVVFSSKDNQSKIIDFSISTISNESLDLINEPGGSFHFQAPELFNQYNKNIKRGYYDPFKADIWSVGVTLYLFLFEQFPFDSYSELELQMKIIKDEIIFPIEDAQEEVIGLICRLLKKNPDERLTDIELILNDCFFN